MATVSSHVLDSVIGDHGGGIRIELYRLSGSAGKEPLFDVIANEEGRISESVDIDPTHRDAQYELVFHTADYFKTQPLPEDAKQIMDVVVVRMRMPNPEAKYHIPLMLSPHAYSIWWSGIEST